MLQIAIIIVCLGDRVSLAPINWWQQTAFLEQSVPCGRDSLSYQFLSFACAHAPLAKRDKIGKGDR